MPQQPDCHICGGPLLALDSYPVAHQVTSDCRPWKGEEFLAICTDCGAVQKPVTKNWLREVQEIYASYAVYSQGAGLEQVSFDQRTGASSARSDRIVEWLQRNGTLSSSGTVLDVGCGNGAFLRAFGKGNPYWQMEGLELDARNKSPIESIPGVTRLHVGPIESLQTRFDLVVLIHALEHIPGPIQYLQTLVDLLNPGGLLLIEVPDLETSPFDILIADHCTHFNSFTLREIVGKAGFEVLRLEGGCVAKELTLLARYPSMPVRRNASIHELNGEVATREHLVWLHKLLEQGQSTSGPLGVFGTSISATWLAAALGDKVEFFIDEDVNRAGRKHMGYSIYSPNDAPKDSPVLMPLRADIAAAVAKRLAPFNLAFSIPPIAHMLQERNL